MEVTMDTEMMKTPSKMTGDSDSDLPSLEYLKDCVNEFITTTEEPRAISEKCRDYYDGKQWTDEQIEELQKRKQAPVVNNRIKVKQNGLLGLMALRRSEPKAYPRNQKDSDTGAAEATTDGLVYAADRVSLNSVMTNAADNFFCEGYCGIHIPVEVTRRGDVEVVVEKIEWDRIFFDPYSRKPDFSDSRGKGFKVWMDEEDIEDMFGEVEEDVFSEPETSQEDFFDDKPMWFNKSGKRKRHLVATHYFKWKGQWYYAIYTGSGFLVPPSVSPYLDEEGEPMCPLELVHAYIDRENGRYGELKSFLDLQDEINHRRSKALFLLSQRQTFGTRGAIPENNIKKAKRELAKPNGHLEINNGELNKDFGILPTNDMAQGQMEMYIDAKAEMDAQSYSAQMAGERQNGDLSGVAIKRLQNAGIVELNKLFENFSDFKLRVYKQMWMRMKQYWDKEKWVRVTDDEDNLRWIGFNIPVTMKKFLEDTMADEEKPKEMRLGASAQLILLEQQDPQALEELVEVQNRPAELDMDIIIDESFDFINASEEQLDAILQFGAQGQFDIIDLLDISNIRHKERLIERIENRRKEAAEAAASAPPDPQSTYLQSKAKEAEAGAAEKAAKAQHQELETQVLATTPQLPYKTNVSI